jgi:hypothetical protein
MTRMTSKIAPKPPQAAPAAPTAPAPLSPERARELVREGRALRQEIQERYAKMRVLTDEDLKLRTK